MLWKPNTKNDRQPAERRTGKMLLGMISAAVVAGCGASVSPPDTAGDTKSVVFTEDADPAVAALAYRANELIVQPYPGVPDDKIDALIEQIGATHSTGLGEIDAQVLQIDEQSLQSAADLLANSGLIETIQKNYLYQPSEVASDPLFDRQSYLGRIGLEQAWDTSVGSDEVVIAIVDTGVDPDHPDLTDKILSGWNVVENNDDFHDDLGHGTMVASVAAARTDNGRGIAGVTWESPLMAVRVTDDNGDTSASDIAAGILWASAHGAKVINVSFAPLWSNRVVKAAAQQANLNGSLVLISAGNAGGLSDSEGYAEGLFVGALGSSSTIARFSDRGPFVDLAAPGVGIQVALAGGDYGASSGTSFAAPIVAGVAALAWSANPNLRPISIQQALLETAVDAGPAGIDDTYGYGIVDAEAAVQAAASHVEERDTVPPRVSISQPHNGFVLTRRTTTAVTATDSRGVADVVMQVDGLAVATDTRSPYRFTLDPEGLSPGTHSLSFVATDQSGNASDPAGIQFTIRSAVAVSDPKAGSIQFTSPRPGAIVQGDVSITASVSDPDGLATVEWFVDGVPVFAASASGSSSGVSFLLRTGDMDPGTHTITLALTDRQGNRTAGDLSVTTR